MPDGDAVDTDPTRPDDRADPPTVAELAAAFDLDPQGAEVVRAASRHVVRFPASAVRTFAVPGPASAVRGEAAVARALAEVDVPAARLLSGPASVGGWAVTAWGEIPGAPSTADDADVDLVDATVVGALAARLHRATAGLEPTAVGTCDPIGGALAQLDEARRAGASPDADLAVLRREARRLAGVWGAATEAARGPGGATALVHGDLHPGNVVAGRDGPVLVDLELAGWGPTAYDAAPTVAGVRRYGRPRADLAAFDRGYGAPLTDTAAALRLDEVWALWATCWAVANRHRSPAAEEEAAVRVASLATGEAPQAWRLR